MTDFAAAARAALEAVLRREPAALLIVYEAPMPGGNHLQGHVAVPNAPSVAVGLAITGLAQIVPE
jgi:hypothetical protein